MVTKSIDDIRGSSQSPSSAKQIRPISNRWQTSSDAQSFIDDRCPTVWQAVRPNAHGGVHPPRHTVQVKSIDMSLMDGLYNAVQDEKHRQAEEEETQVKQRIRVSHEQTSSARQQAAAAAAEHYSETQYERVTRPPPAGPRGAPNPAPIPTSPAEAHLTTGVQEKSAATGSTRTRSGKGFHIKGEEAFVDMEVPAVIEPNLPPLWTDPIQMAANVRSAPLQETKYKRKDTASRGSDRTSKDAKAGRQWSTTETKRDVELRQSSEALMSSASPDSSASISRSKLQAQSAKQSQVGSTGMFSQMGNQHSRNKLSAADKQPTVESVISSHPLDKSTITVKLWSKVPSEAAPSSRSFEEISQELYTRGGTRQITQHLGFKPRPPSVQGSGESVSNWGALADSAIASQKSSEGRFSVKGDSAWHQSTKSKQSGPPEKFPASEIWGSENPKDFRSTITLSPIGNEVKEGSYHNESSQHSACNLALRTGSYRGSHVIAVRNGVKSESEQSRQSKISGDLSAPAFSPVGNVWGGIKRDRSIRFSQSTVQERPDDDFVEVAIGWDEEGEERVTLIPRSSAPSVRDWAEKDSTSWKTSLLQGSRHSSHGVSQSMRKRDDCKEQDFGRKWEAGDSRVSSERNSRRQSQARRHTLRKDDDWEEQGVGQAWAAPESRVASTRRTLAPTQSKRSEARAEGFDNASARSLHAQQDHSGEGSSGAGFSQAPPAFLGSCPTKDGWKPMSQDSRRQSYDPLSPSRSQVVTVQSDGSERPPSTSARESYGHSGTIFAGKGWISPHPLSLASTNLESPPASKIELPSMVFPQGATMTYEEWKRIQEDGMRANGNFSTTKSSRGKTIKLGEIRYRFSGWGENSSDGYRFEKVCSQGSGTKSGAPSNYRPPTVQSENSSNHTPSAKPRQTSSCCEKYRPDAQKSQSQQSSYYEQYRPQSAWSHRSCHDEHHQPQRSERTRRSRQSTQLNSLSSSRRGQRQSKSMVPSKTASASATSLSEREREWEVMEEGRNVWSMAPQSEIANSHVIRDDADSQTPTSELYFERYAGSHPTTASQKW